MVNKVLCVGYSC